MAFPNTLVNYVTWKGNQFSGRAGNSFTTGSADGNIVKGALSAARPCRSCSRARSGQLCSLGSRALKCDPFSDPSKDFGK
jgi:hypothetical protein